MNPCPQSGLFVLSTPRRRLPITTAASEKLSHHRQSVSVDILPRSAFRPFHLTPPRSSPRRRGECPEGDLPSVFLVFDVSVAPTEGTPCTPRPDHTSADPRSLTRRGGPVLRLSGAVAQEGHQPRPPPPRHPLRQPLCIPCIPILHPSPRPLPCTPRRCSCRSPLPAHIPWLC